MFAILKREFRACFQSVIGWLFLAATLALYFLYFYVYNLSYGYPYISTTLSAISILFLITVPVLTMRIFAEERHAKTDQLIFTAPVSIGKIVLGKYLALAAVFTIAVVIISFTPLLLGRYGEVPYLESYVAVLGFWLYGLTCIAIGTFVSALTESQVIAAVLTFVFLFLGYMMDGITQTISASGNFITKLLNCYNLTAGTDKLSKGELDVTAVIYYVSVSLLFLFLTTQAIQKRRWSVSVKKLGMGIFNLGFAAAAIAVVVVLNLAAGALPSVVTNIDCTGAQLYAITDGTKQMLSSLKKQVELFVLANESSQDEQLGTTLKKYKELSSNIKLTYVDPAVSPNFYQKYTDDAVAMNSVIAVCGERSKVISYSDIYETEVDYQTYSSKTTGYDAEGQLTSAIQYITSDDLQTVYEITGHGEEAISGSFKEVIEKMNLNLESFTLLEAEQVPKDCELLVINGPTADFSKDDADKVIQYLQDGGKAFITAQYTKEDLANFKKILDAYGLELCQGGVIEGDTQHYSQNPMYLIPDVESDEITSDVYGEYVFAPFAQGLKYEEKEDGEISYTKLLTTSDQAFLKTDYLNMQTFDKEKGDVDGPFSIGVSVADSKTGARLIVYSSTRMFSDDADNVVAGHNSALFASSIKSMAGEAEESNLIVVPVKEYTMEALTAPQSAVILTGFLTVLAVPVIMIALGVVIWMKRRKA